MLQVSVAAYSGEPTRDMVDNARRFVDGIARCSCGRVVLFLGGYKGLMRVVVDEALRHGLGVVLIIPVEYEGEHFPEQAIVVRTGLGLRERSSVLVRSGSVLVSLGGGVGTFFEELIAYSYGIPVIRVARSGGELLTDRLAECFPSGRLDVRINRRILYVDNGFDAAEKACRLVLGANSCG